MIRPATDSRLRSLLVALLCICASLPAAAQDKPTLTSKDYDQWESLGSFQLSPDGEWIASSIVRVDGDTRLELTRTDGKESPIVLEFARSAVFSPDSKWMTYRKGVSAEESENAESPIPDKLGLVDLTSRTDTVMMEITSAAFSHDGQWLAAMGAAPADTVGGDLVVFHPGADLKSTLGSVGSFSWQENGPLLAFSIRSATGSGNGVSLYHPGESRLVALASGSAHFGTPTWHEESNALAVFRSVPDDSRVGDAQDILYWEAPYDSPSQLKVLTNDREVFGDSLGISEHGGIEFANSGKILFFGVGPWELEKKESTDPTCEDDGCDDSSDTTSDEEADEKDTDETEPEPSDVQIWHWDDDDILRGQEYWATRNSQRTLMSAWHLTDDSVVRLGTEYDEPVSVAGSRGAWGIVGDLDPDHINLRYGLGTTDYYKVNVSDGSRTLLAEALYQTPLIGPAGNWVLYAQNGSWRAHHLDSGEEKEFAGGSASRSDAPDFEMSQKDYDYPGPHPLWSRPAWYADDEAALMVGRYDIWKLDFGSGQVERLTAGEEEGLQYRPYNMDPEASFFAPPELEDGDDVWVTIRNTETMASGYGMLDGSGVVSLRYEDAGLIGLKMSENGRTYAFSRQSWVDSPNVYAGENLQNAVPVTDTNPFQSDYAWGRNELLHYTTDAGHDLMAVLTYPADFQEGQTYPLILYQYEKLSSTLHRYDVPRQTRYYNYQTWSQNGYFVLRPDVIYEDGRPGPSAVDAFNSALDVALETGHIDENALGLIGHSWGGYQAAYVPTRTDRFAASVAGAAITDFISFPGTVHWSGGLEEFGHWERGQARMARPPWEDMEGHLESSPINFIDDLNTPVLVMHGDDDGVVDFRQGLQYYNYARRAGKPVVMLVYPGAGHGLSVEHQQVDYHTRILEWFDHWLKGSDAPSWIKSGESWEERAKRMGDE